MSSRAEYLAKYMSGSNEPKKKKKKKTKKVETESTTLITVDAPVISVPEPLDEIPLEDLSEMAPVQVELKSKPNKGFKRIDNGAFVKKEPQAIVSNPENEQPQTIYRDSSGRVIDITERKQQFDEKKHTEMNKRTFVEVRLDEEEQQKQSNVSFKPRESNFEDPLALFDEPSTETNVESKYVYTKGTNPENRYHIKAGYFWDGIDRSNGFEILKIRQLNQKRFSKIDNSINESYDVEYDL
jgi:pre-mRNA-splicing factor CWC26